MAVNAYCYYTNMCVCIYVDVVDLFVMVYEVFNVP